MITYGTGRYREIMLSYRYGCHIASTVCAALEGMDKQCILSTDFLLSFCVFHLSVIHNFLTSGRIALLLTSVVGK